jgi:hypothetical protein
MVAKMLIKDLTLLLVTNHMQLYLCRNLTTPYAALLVTPVINVMAMLATHQ